MKKIEVNGDGADPLWVHMKAAVSGPPPLAPSNTRRFPGAPAVSPQPRPPAQAPTDARLPRLPGREVELLKVCVRKGAPPPRARSLGRFAQPARECFAHPAAPPPLFHQSSWPRTAGWLSATPPRRRRRPSQQTLRSCWGRVSLFLGRVFACHRHPTATAEKSRRAGAGCDDERGGHGPRL